MNTIKVGDRIRTTDSGLDDESGRVLEIDVDIALIGWESGVQTWTPVEGLELAD